jgi:hypothetical protein
VPEQISRCGLVYSVLVDRGKAGGELECWPTIQQHSLAQGRFEHPHLFTAPSPDFVRWRFSDAGRRSARG